MAQYIATRNTMYLCLESERRPGSMVAKCWWEDLGLRLAAAQGDEEKDGTEESGGMEE